MKINISQMTKAMGAYKNQKTGQVKSDKKQQHTKDEVVLSEQAQAFQIALKAAKDSPDVREAKIEEIRFRMETGQYQVDSKKIAEKMLDDILKRK